MSSTWLWDVSGLISAATIVSTSPSIWRMDGLVDTMVLLFSLRSEIAFNQQFGLVSVNTEVAQFIQDK